MFSYDTRSALASAADLVNTAPDAPTDRPERLGTVDALREFVARWGWTGPIPIREDELERVHAVRRLLRELWDAASDETRAVDLINRMLREAAVLPQLVRHDDWPYHLHGWSDSTPIAERFLAEPAMGLVDVVRAGELDRLRACAAPDCAGVFVDLSRNSSRRFCDDGCNNRLNVAAYRARRA
ncbi:CGNR zinc finger domain-containing protein [Tsukamurella sp. 1534]|uniref:CGNR zinc finger domain-containing protein n=1 Tax=Tsukamurella sp. 1534 TaxID=1151061 RepID=UPI0002D4C73F|nr:CGNR zinc finger domain-containing protein [Tsukamurella sp. 1534]